jgi:chromosome segregation ATPase
MSEKINLRVRLDFDQRARAYKLEDDVGTDESATASEIIFLRDSLTALQTEFEAVRAERVQLETLCASRADEIHKLNNQLTAVTLERDALRRDIEIHNTGCRGETCTGIDLEPK